MTVKNWQSIRFAHDPDKLCTGNILMALLCFASLRSASTNLSGAILILFLNAALNLFGLIREHHNQTTPRANQASFAFGSVIGFVPWTCALQRITRRYDLASGDHQRHTRVLPHAADLLLATHCGPSDRHRNNRPAVDPPSSA